MLIRNFKILIAAAAAIFIISSLTGRHRTGSATSASTVDTEGPSWEGMPLNPVSLHEHP